MQYNILVADSDEAFASILKERLEALGKYRVALANDGNAALESVVTQPFDLLILDVGLKDSSLPDLLNRVHAIRPSLRIAMVPYPENQVPSVLRDIPVHGLLPKPFTADELPLLIQRILHAEAPVPLSQIARVSDAQSGAAEEDEIFALFSDEGSVLTKLTGDVTDTATTHGSPTGVLSRGTRLATTMEAPMLDPELVTILSQEGVSILKGLEHELQATLIMLSADARPIASSGSLPQEHLWELSRLIAQQIEASAQVMHFLSTGSEGIALILAEGEEHRVYSTQVAQTVWLTVVADLRIPLGSLRYHTRKAADRLVSLIR